MFTYEDYKIIRNLDSNDNMEQIEFIIEMVNEEIQDYTNQDYSENMPKALKLIAAELTDFYLNREGIYASQSLEGNSFTINENYHKTLLKKLNNYSRIRTVSD
jgi:hypothetical protein